MCSSELRSVICRVRSSGRAPRLDFWSFTTILGMFFAGLGCFWRGPHWGYSPKAGSTKWEKSVEELGENVQAKSRRCFRFQIFCRKTFRSCSYDGASARLQSCSGNSLCKQLFFYNLNLFQFDGVQVQPNCGRRIMTELEILQHPLSK